MELCGTDEEVMSEQLLFVSYTQQATVFNFRSKVKERISRSNNQEVCGVVSTDGLMVVAEDYGTQCINKV